MQTALSFKKILLSLQILFVRHNRQEHVTYCCLFMTKMSVHCLLCMHLTCRVIWNYLFLAFALAPFVCVKVV